MGIKIDFEKKFIVNGREYHSWEEVPEDLRRLGAPALNPAGDLPSGLISPKQSIVFNGKQYEDLSAMPEEERKMFEMIMKSLKIEGDTQAQAGSMPKNQGGGNITLSLEAYRKGKTGSPSFSSNWLLKGVVVLGLLGGAYYLLK
ncbi:MAG: hypothetical protein HY892_05985 [Deltaproteobacteria bacterium]|nr:hypothetical protein [Deltaproteobacteria bacterium]